MGWPHFCLGGTWCHQTHFVSLLLFSVRDELIATTEGPPVGVLCSRRGCRGKWPRDQSRAMLRRARGDRDLAPASLRSTVGVSELQPGPPVRGVVPSIAPRVSAVGVSLLPPVLPLSSRALAPPCASVRFPLFTTPRTRRTPAHGEREADFSSWEETVLTVQINNSD